MKTELEHYINESIYIESTYPKEKQISSLYEKLMIEAGFEVEEVYIDGERRNLLATKGSGDQAILFYGHMDTVAPVDGWSTDPFEPVVKDGKLYGLGSYDMKGGIAAILDATIDTDAYVKLMLAVDEENISEGAWKVLQERRDYFDDVALIVSAEPNFELGLHGITRGRTGRCVYQVNCQGKPVHIARHHEGIDAIEILVDFSKKLYQKRQLLFSSPQTVVQIRKLVAESIGMSVCGLASAEIEVLLGAGDSVEDVNSILSALDERVEIMPKPRKTPYLEGYYFDTFPYQDQIAQIVHAETGKAMTLHERSSVGDDNVLASLGIPVITWGPDGGNAHAADEYVDLESLRQLSKMYRALLEVHSKKR